MKYRREIDGLRAIAVLPVILFHGGSDVFSGGYIGVDVFFVISGYLITNIIATEIESGTFRLSNFYERRARRILPALFLVLGATLPFAWLWMYPTDFSQFSLNMVSVSLFSSNVMFWLESGYFSPAAELKPLLHTWSLAVEEQYYLLFPLLLLATRRRGAGVVLQLLAVMFIGSIALSAWSAGSYPDAGFFLMPMRLWELLLGSFCAYEMLRRERIQPRQLTLSLPLQQFLGIAGLVLILFSMFSFDELTPFPGWHALLPTTGTALIILFASDASWVGRFLSMRPLVGIGLVSYSAYLWHQPLFALAHAQVKGAPGTPVMLLLGASSLLLAYFSWKYVETPFRLKHRVSRQAIFRWSLVGILAFSGLGLLGYFSQGFPLLRYTSSQVQLLSYRAYDRSSVYREGVCFLKPEQSYAAFGEECTATGNEGTSFLIWGDSHAAALSSGLRELSQNVTQFTASGCPPILATERFNDRMYCQEINQHVLARITELQPDVILLHADWVLYSSASLFRDTQETLIKVRQQSPESSIILLGPVPRWPMSLPGELYAAGNDLSKVVSMPTPMLFTLEQLDETYRNIASASEAGFVSLVEELCMNDQCYSVVENDGILEPLVWDNSHLTSTGSVFTVKRIMPAVLNLSGNHRKPGDGLQPE